MHTTFVYVRLKMPDCIAKNNLYIYIHIMPLKETRDVYIHISVPPASQERKGIEGEIAPS